jgi:hypothetical protein
MEAKERELEIGLLTNSETTSFSTERDDLLTSKMNLVLPREKEVGNLLEL